MELVTYEVLRALPLTARYEEAFCKATGVTLSLMPPDECHQRFGKRMVENPFCEMVGSRPDGCEACLQTQKSLQEQSAKDREPRQMTCFAGLTDFAVPVLADGRHVATFLSGQVFLRKPSRKDFDVAMKWLGAGRDKCWQQEARKAFFATPVLTPGNIEAAIQLLTVFAQHLPKEAERHVLVSRGNIEPVAVTTAKRYIDDHFQENLTLDQVLKNAHVSRFHFCKIFKRTTGATFTEYVTRLRVNRAKVLLLDPGNRVSEVVFAVGFGSIPQFNSVFKRLVGKSPTEYRAQLRKELIAGKI